MNFDAYRTVADISIALSGFIGISAYLFAMILFDSPEKLDDHA